jgi:single-strand DNA-binding protein
MNSVVIIGNLTRDPELRYSTGANQTAFCRFTVAVNDRRRNAQTQQWEDNTSFIPVVVFGRQAENCDRYLAKGRKVAVQGRIQTGSYTNKEGNKVYTTDVVANNVEFLGGGNSSSGQGGFGGQGFGGGQNNGGYGQQSFGGQGQQGFGQQAPQGGFPQEEPFQAAPQEEPFQQAPQQSEPAGIPEGFQALQDDDIPF